jgi:hypothetical protein
MAQTEHFDRIPYNDSEQQTWASDEYEAGYQARLRDAAEYHTATLCWRTGWQEADRDLQIGNAMPTGESDDIFRPRWSDFGTGQDARACELPFDDSQARPGSEAGPADIAIRLVLRREV